ncbi:hypothetical protein SVA_2885 [Sulfurifustis variabilis]|uniref:Uncharacterized protein n=1 Tax=Sulfurifustis variabilis TaxID=1675686 RepID=A0A1B4V7A6_9GAMM|nr:DUF169 domain-containing protein [Sulfurifustis variabilis]BAU49433.1 hypothetical protein SVA_2885 [Sulfurifustis variabilis]
MRHDYRALSKTLVDLLALSAPPLAITFTQEDATDVPRYEGTMPASAPDGRTGKVTAGCVFWMKAVDRTFRTHAEDHGNCSVGSLTHGFITLDTAAKRDDVKALMEASWVTPEVFPQIPVVKQRPASVIYGPLADTRVDPDVVFLRLNGKQAMILHDALPDLRFEGKPQCHIIPIAKEEGQVALSVGCMLSRTRTGMANSEMTCAIPGTRLADVVARLQATCRADVAVATYAADDARRFGARSG